MTLSDEYYMVTREKKKNKSIARAIDGRKTRDLKSTEKDDQEMKK